MSPSPGLASAVTGARIPSTHSTKNAKRTTARVPTLFLLLALSFCVQCILSSSDGRMRRFREKREAIKLRRIVDQEAEVLRLDVWQKRQLEEVDWTELANGGEELSYPEYVSASNEGTDEDGGGSGTMLNIDYQGWYGSLSPAARPFGLGALAIWVIFLFATIGICASDFFCPNLATVADRLGMSESTAGVTFLAFGNGSPDVFSTFSALRSNTFSLAIGELLGASTFIVSVVVGSMALVQPFHVPRWPFIRDVGFFTVAVMILVACLGDGRLTLWEGGGLVGMYVIYVGIVVGGNWWMGRRRRLGGDHEHKTGRITLGDGVGEVAEWDDDEEELDEVSELRPDILVVPADSQSTIKSNRSRSVESGRPRSTTASSYEQSLAPLTPHSQTPAPRREVSRRTSNATLRKGSPSGHRRPVVDTPRPHFSLLGAIEFRDAVNALRKESAAASAAENGEALPTSTRLTPALDDLLGTPAMEDYFGPVSPFTSGHYHHHLHKPTPRDLSPSNRLTRNRSASQARSSRNGLGIRPGPMANGEGRAATVAELSTERENMTASSILEVRRASAGAVETLTRPPTGTEEPSSGSITPTADEEPAQGRMFADSYHLGPPGFEVPLQVKIPSAPSDGGYSDSPVPTTAAEGETGNAAEDSTLNGNGEHLHSYLREDGTSVISNSDRIRKVVHTTFHLLFPSLHAFRRKSWIAKFLAVFAAPAILALTLTLPVVDDCAEGLTVNRQAIALANDDSEPMDLGQAENGHAGTEEEAEVEDARQVAGEAGRHLHFMVSGSPLPSPATGTRSVKNLSSIQLSEIDGESDGEMIFLFNKYLAAAQCLVGALFCSYAIFSGQSWGKWAIIAIVLAGTASGAAVLKLGEHGHDPFWRMVRCSAGFFSAIVWISAIADEMVQVLLTFGVILGLSDAIVGLTIFAIGASMADLISNLTVAAFAPSMSYAACFGGPMLNVLLGIGGAGSYAVLSTGRAYEVHFSSTLWVSAIGLIIMLVSTLCFVPYNGYYISRPWASCLIGFYVVLTTVNIIVEIRSEG